MNPFAPHLIALVAAGGAAGAVLRYAVGIWCAGGFGTAQPGGTLAVNVAETWRHGTLGYRVLHELVGRCMRLGITTFNLDYAASNIALQSAIDAIAAETGVRYTLSGVTRAGIGHLTVRAER